MRLSLASCFALVPFFASDGIAATPGSASPLQSEYYASIEARLGSIRLDGTLKLEFPLDVASCPPTLIAGLKLEHRIKVNARGAAVSVWEIPALRTFLVPAGRADLLWQKPDGTHENFDLARIGTSLTLSRDSSWQIRRGAPGVYEIRSSGGAYWRYEQGAWARFESPLFGQFVVVAQGGLVREVRPAGTSTDRRVLCANYNQRGQVLSLMGHDPSQTHRFEWDDSGMLVRWTQPGGEVTNFAYAQGLLAAVEEGDAPARHFQWSPNPDWQRGDSIWPAPVHLSSDEHCDYSYRQSSKGFLIKSHDRQAGTIVRTRFNPRRYRLEQFSAAATLVVSLRSRLPHRGAVENIETADGVRLEEFIYDPVGNLVEVHRRGRAPVHVRHDDIGRVLDAQVSRQIESVLDHAAPP